MGTCDANALADCRTVKECAQQMVAVVNELNQENAGLLKRVETLEGTLQHGIPDSWIQYRPGARVTTGASSTVLLEPIARCNDDETVIGGFCTHNLTNLIHHATSARRNDHEFGCMFYAGANELANGIERRGAQATAVCLRSHQ